MYRAEFWLLNGSNGPIVADFDAFEVICGVLEAAGVRWDSKEEIYRLTYPPGFEPTDDVSPRTESTAHTETRPQQA